MSETTIYHADPEGCIVCQAGAILYEADSIDDLSPAARDYLAHLHTIYPDLEWEGNLPAGVPGAEDYLLWAGHIKQKGKRNDAAEEVRHD